MLVPAGEVSYMIGRDPLIHVNEAAVLIRLDWVTTGCQPQ